MDIYFKDKLFWQRSFRQGDSIFLGVRCQATGVSAGARFGDNVLGAAFSMSKKGG